ncbi:MAG TPA: hypothetical protein VIM62_06925 [Acidobacteriaceae bacterium]
MLHPHWPIWLRLLLYAHIASGIVGFLCAPIALVTKKGGSNHRYWGKIYFWAMTGVAVTALILSFALPIWFLAMVSVFSFYAAFAAYRILSLKDLVRGGRPKGYDWAAALITLASSAVLCLAGIFAPLAMRIGVIHIAGRPISIVSVVFGIIGMRMAWNTLHTFLGRPQDRMFWWYDHLQGMTGSYIAAMTAFSSVNLSHWFGPAWWVWLWPTILGVPAIALWTAYYKKKFASSRKPAAVV